MYRNLIIALVSSLASQGLCSAHACKGRHMVAGPQDGCFNGTRRVVVSIGHCNFPSSKKPTISVSEYVAVPGDRLSLRIIEDSIRHNRFTVEVSARGSKGDPLVCAPAGIDWTAFDGLY
jgi:hypothetical protein